MSFTFDADIKTNLAETLEHGLLTMLPKFGPFIAYVHVPYRTDEGEASISMAALPAGLQDFTCVLECHDPEGNDRVTARGLAEDLAERIVDWYLGTIDETPHEVD